MGAAKVIGGVMFYRVRRRERKQTPRAGREMFCCIVAPPHSDGEALLNSSESHASVMRRCLFVCLFSVLLLAHGYLLKT